MMDYPNLAVLQANVNATKAKMADLEGQLAQARDENAAREREIITAMLKQAKLPDRLESRSFRAEVNQIAEHWSRYGPSKSGLTFGTLICHCRSLPRTDWDLLQRHPETFREQAPSVNERLGTWKWEVWEWFRKFVNPEFQKSCIVGEISNLFISVFSLSFGYANTLEEWFLKISRMIFSNSRINCNESKCRLAPQKPFSCLPQLSRILPQHRLIKLLKLRVLNHGVESPLAQPLVTQENAISPIQ